MNATFLERIESVIVGQRISRFGGSILFCTDAKPSANHGTASSPPTPTSSTSTTRSPSTTLSSSSRPSRPPIRAPISSPSTACGSVSESSLAFLNDRVKVRASCNGLLCCASVPNRGLYYVCNPFTGESKALPRTRERPVSRYHPDYEATLVGLAFDPSKRGFTVALAGFYRPFGWRPFDRLVCSVFDSETNSWRKFVSSHYDEFTHMNRNQVVFVNGRLHWLTMSCSYVLTLDPIEGLWRKVSAPVEILAEKFGARVYLLEMEGKLSVVQMTEATMNVWVLEDYGIEEWRVVERVNLRCIKGFVPNAFPIGMSNGVVFLATRKTVLMYERKSKVWKEVYSGRDGFIYPLWFSAYAFKSTLSSFG
ncbi:F-box protein [Acorus calamus]|uniref:F-box protein n=1 Tax=Acorus calamus TaxID=4465 RepID=A0AAV9CZQ0_ACOCL|nr:F-box protein [Acorus calamus]